MNNRIKGIIIIAGLALAACGKTDSLPTRFTPIPTTNTNVKFLNMSPDAPAINFYAGGSKATAVVPNTAGVVQGMGFPTIYPAVIGYASIGSGAQKIDARVPDSATTMAGQNIHTSTPTFVAGKFYTYTLVDSLSKLSAVVVEDDPTVADASKAYIRVANFIPNGNVHIEVVKTSSGNVFNAAYNNVSFKTISNFDSLGAGAGQTYRVYLRNSTNNAKLDSISAFVPSNTKKYTIYARGVLGQTGSSNTRRPIITNYINF